MPATRRPSRSAVWSTAPSPESASRQPSGPRPIGSGPRRASGRWAASPAASSRWADARRWVESSRRRSTSPVADVEVEGGGARRAGAASGPGAMPRRPACIRCMTRVRSPSASTPISLPRRQTPLDRPPDERLERRLGGLRIAAGWRTRDALDRAGRAGRASSPSASACSSGSSGTGRARGRRYTRPDVRAAHSRRAVMRAEDLTKTLDHTVLSPDVTEADDRERACAEAREHHFAALCSYPRFVPLMADLPARLRREDLRGDRLPRRGELDGRPGRRPPTARSPRAPTSSTSS